MDARDKIISLAKEYVEAVDCSCPKSGENRNGVLPYVCWKCLFEYNLSFIEPIHTSDTPVIDS